MRTLLFIAYYLPPMGSSGVQRPLNLLRHLPAHGWNPVVLAPETGLYHTIDQTLGDELDGLGLTIYRVKANTPFHRGGGGAKQAPRIPEGISKLLRWASSFRYLPDNKRGWIEPALAMSTEIIGRHKPELIFATSPPPSNLMLAGKIRKQTGLPTVFDFRDDWVGNHQQIYPTPWHRKRMAELERDTVAQSDAMVAVNPVIRDALRLRHPDYDRPIESISSGFDASRFAHPGTPSYRRDPDKLTLLYSGRFYGENQPDAFILAAASLIRRRPELRSSLRLAFQGGLENRHRAQLQSAGLGDLVLDLGYVDHATAVGNLLEADMLWLVAAHRNRGEQVSTGKVFEYMASGKPIFALAPKGGALHELITGYGPFAISEPDQIGSIETDLESLIFARLQGTLPSVNQAHVSSFTFERMASDMASLFNHVAPPKPG